MTYPAPTREQIDFYGEHGWLVVEDAIAHADLDELALRCERIIEEKETLANDWAWDARESKDQRSFRIVQGSPTKVWPEIAQQPLRKWLTEFGSALMGLDVEFWYDQVLAKPPSRSAQRYHCVFGENCMTRLSLALLSMVFAVAAFGADARKYAVLSLIGDEMLIVGAGQATGQRLDRNPRSYVRLDDPIIDKTVLLTANETLKRETGVDPVLLFAQERPLYAMQQRLMNEGRGMVNLLGYIRPLVGNSGATHLVLFTKARREARMQLPDMALGTGMVEGVGFYVDPNTEVLLRDRQQVANGFVAAFTYFDVALVDLGKGAIVGEQRVMASKVMAAPASVATEVWSGISGAEKMRMLTAILRREVERTIPALLKESN